VCKEKEKLSTILESFLLPVAYSFCIHKDTEEESKAYDPK